MVIVGAVVAMCMRFACKSQTPSAVPARVVVPVTQGFAVAPVHETKIDETKIHLGGPTRAAV